ncbi:MAG: hypothetical protein HGA76_03620 [Candidatus Firestonebacteria bacterium]|nr:hypothetical protein [Candidatus Firestonebacteria bacterium]
MPWRFRAGAAWAYADGISALDLLTTDDNERLAGGTEYWWFHRTLGTRLGLGAGNAGLLEITAGLSLHLQFSDWAPQLDYAFVNPLSDFSGVGSSHRLNLSLAWGTPVEGAQTLSGRQLKARGDEAYQRGNTEEALDAYEQAAETLPEDRILAARIEFLRAHVAHAAEIQLYLKQGLEFQKSGNYQNALAVYQKILNQEANLEAANQMAAVKAAMQRMTEEQKSEHQKQERMAAEEARQTALEESKDALQAAQRSLERARRSAEVRRWLGADLARLEKQWNAANQLWRQGEAEQAQGLAEALAREADKLSSKAARHQTQENRAHASSETSPREETDRPAAEPTPAPAAGRLPSTPAVAEKVPGGGEKAGRTPAEENRHRRARGAYGRAVKLMLDIDKLQGQRFFPDEFSALQNEISRLKTLTAGENDTAVISYAEGLFPQMERLKAKCQEKKKVSEVMPTNW